MRFSVNTKRIFISYNENVQISLVLRTHENMFFITLDENT